MNSGPIEASKTTFCKIHGLKILINEPTSYKNPKTPLTLILLGQIGLMAFKTPTYLKPDYQISTKRPRLYQKSHSKYKDPESWIIAKINFTKAVSSKKPNRVEVSKQDNSLKRFQEKCFSFNCNDSNKTQIYTGKPNIFCFMNKELQQAIRMRSKLRKKFLKRMFLQMHVSVSLLRKKTKNTVQSWAQKIL